jgi:hypothetical protein
MRRHLCPRLMRRSKSVESKDRSLATSGLAPLNALAGSNGIAIVCRTLSRSACSILAKVLLGRLHYGVNIEPVCTRLSVKSSSRCSVRKTSSSIRPSFRKRMSASRSTWIAARTASLRRL